MTTERLPVETRQVGGRLIGEVFYNRPARDRPEMFEAGAFVSVADPLNLTLQHDRERHPVATTEDGTLEVSDTSTSLLLAARLRPRSAEQRLVETGALGGLSVEFVALEERQADGVRIIPRAHLDGIGLVDSGSYPSRVELRRMSGAWLRGSIPLGDRMECECQGPDCDAVVFDGGAFDDLLSGDGEVLAVGGGGFANVLGSRKRGTLLVEQEGDRLAVGLTKRDTETARRVIDANRVAPVYARPLLDLDASEYVDADRVRTFSVAKVRAFLFKPTTNDKGHVPVTIAGEEVRQRRRFWL